MKKRSILPKNVITLKGNYGKCPICKGLATQKFRPFCSKECSNKDLGRWLNESYKFETDETPETIEED